MALKITVSKKRIHKNAPAIFVGRIKNGNNYIVITSMWSLEVEKTEDFVDILEKLFPGAEIVTAAKE